MKKKILLVDDDKGIVEVIKRALEEEGFEVAFAYDGAEGFEKLQSESPDLIILDISMPSMNGYEFMRALRAKKVIEVKPVTPVIVLTAKEEMKEMFKLEGAKEYLVKPVEAPDLIQKVRKQLKSDD